MNYQYVDLDWAGVWPWKRCKSRFKALHEFRGRCELKRNHSGDHAAERGMVWVRWGNQRYGNCWLTTPGSPDQEERTTDGPS